MILNFIWPEYNFTDISSATKIGIKIEQSDFIFRISVNFFDLFIWYQDVWYQDAFLFPYKAVYTFFIFRAAIYRLSGSGFFPG